MINKKKSDTESIFLEGAKVPGAKVFNKGSRATVNLRLFLCDCMVMQIRLNI